MSACKFDKVGRLYQSSFLNCGILLLLCKMLPQGNWVKCAWVLPVLFPQTACQSMIISKEKVYTQRIKIQVISNGKRKLNQMKR